MKSFPAYDLEHWSDFVETCLSELKSLHLNQLNEAIPVLKPTGAQAIIEQILGHGESGKKQLQSIFEFSNHLHHPGYIGHQVVPPSIPSVMAALIGNYLNQGMAIYDMGQSATAIERWVVKKLLSFFNWQEGEGIMTSGGSIGNLTALLAARQSVEDMWNEGVNPNYCVLVSADAHYCVDRAVRIMGFGSEAVVKVKPNTQHKLDAAALEEALINVRLKGKKVLAVVASACSTGPGVFDNLKELAAICRKEEIWLHVDAAHGGLLKMSEQYSYLLEGIEEADSITIDFHKLGFTPALTTAVLYRKALDSYRPFTQEASYLWSEEAEDPGIQSGLRTLECTKLMMGLKAFANLVWLGEDEMRRMMDSLVSQTRDFASWLQDQPGWELFQYPEANILCFKSTDYSEKQHKEALKRLVASGTYYIVSTVIDGQFYFRITVMNVYTEESHLKTLIEQLKQHLDECKS